MKNPKYALGMLLGALVGIFVGALIPQSPQDWQAGKALRVGAILIGVVAGAWVQAAITSRRS
jgi:hypothetical protein